jgi:hypothetical protein
MNCAAAEDEQNEKPITYCPVHVNAVAACRLRPAAVFHPGTGRSALAEAISQQNEAALSKVLGDNWQQFLPRRDRPCAVDRFQRDWQVKHVIVQQGDNAWLDVGSEAWRLPVPIVKASQGWRFDMAAGEEEILTRAIGRNELSAIAAMHAYVDAQQDYYQLNHRWAQKIISSEGKKDGCTGRRRRAKRPARWGRPLARRCPARLSWLSFPHYRRSR